MTDATMIMWSIGQIAERDGVSKPAISKQVKKMLEAKPETPVEFDGQGRVLKVSLAHYDEFRHRHINPAKATAPLRPIEGETAEEQPSEPKVAAKDSFEEARRQSEWLKVTRERIRHQEELGQLVRADKLSEAVRSAGTEIRTVLARLQNRSDEFALAVSREGVHGVRVLIRRIVFDLGNEIADKLEQVAAAAPEVDAMIEDGEG